MYVCYFVTVHYMHIFDAQIIIAVYFSFGFEAVAVDIKFLKAKT